MYIEKRVSSTMKEFGSVLGMDPSSKVMHECFDHWVFSPFKVYEIAIQELLKKCSIIVLSQIRDKVIVDEDFSLRKLMADVSKKMSPYFTEAMKQLTDAIAGLTGWKDKQLEKFTEHQEILQLSLQEKDKELVEK